MLDADTVVYSASDLSAAATCEWALMRRLDAKLGRIVASPEPPDAMLERTALLGDRHEHLMLERLRRSHEVVEIARPAVTEIAAAVQQSERALRAGAEVVFQAAFFDGRFLGYADFIIRTPGASLAEPTYEVYDTKLARSAKITALLQLAAYSEQLQSLGIATGEQVHLVLGDGRTSSHRLQDILPVYRMRRARLQSLIDTRLQDSGATEWNDPRYSACGRCALCAEQVSLHRDVLLVANLRLGQRDRLRAAGIDSIDRLAALAPAPDRGPAPQVGGMSEAALATLSQQARLQLASAPHRPE
ncbi:MAG: DNA helicase, partial [Cryobacterium sp.]